MKKKGWKILAIIFILLFITETTFVGYGVYLEKQQQKKIFECINNVCGYNPSNGDWTEEFYNYHYDKINKTCYCFNQQGRVAKIEEFKND